MNIKKRRRIMASRSLEMGAKYNGLRTQGLSGAEAAKTVNDEFGTSLPESTIRRYGSNVKKKPHDVQLSSSREERNEDKASPPVDAHREDLDERMRRIAREVCQEIIHNMETDRNIITLMEDEPPEPTTIKGEGKGRRENRAYEKVSVTIDKKLWERFTADRDSIKVSTGRMMDIILWRYYGRPKLSYGKPESKPEDE
jgi:hypothetical protein